MTRVPDPAARQHLLAEWISGTVREGDGLNATDGYILMLLTLWADNDTGILFPSHETVAKHAGVGVDVVRNSRKRLQAAGVLEVIDNSGGHQASIACLVDYGDRHRATFAEPAVATRREPAAKSDRQRGTLSKLDTPSETATPIESATPEGRNTGVCAVGAGQLATQTSSYTSRSSKDSFTPITKNTARARTNAKAGKKTDHRIPSRRGKEFTRPRRYDSAIRNALEAAASEGVSFSELSRQLRDGQGIKFPDAFDDLLENRLLYFEQQLGVITASDRDRYRPVPESEWPVLGAKKQLVHS